MREKIPTPVLDQTFPMIKRYRIPASAVAPVEIKDSRMSFEILWEEVPVRLCMFIESLPSIIQDENPLYIAF